MSAENSVCPHCGGGPLYARQGVPSTGLFGPNLLPGLDVLAANFDLIACQNCGFVQFFVAKSFRKALAKSWKCISQKANQPSARPVD
jgi:predicted nucleic-acid-binding Zn-ribbon protein